MKAKGLERWACFMYNRTALQSAPVTQALSRCSFSFVSRGRGGGGGWGGGGGNIKKQIIKIPLALAALFS